ncbi:hypothetical protein BC939DRAFT_445161 [Gamsiella multidivaricata]|uniref:uncharacterized protein n=1 Tax=Gamsiella multidivaricata TaxID=101098 RepID=UPI00221EE823|nr:uncharacterized protein BC939DRAFT_445161 [Gamsiella multidivaricata]KAI7827420.1 hypothetical protein BC939DRAFT_445161 [Gamsiella multidivaricata]
MLQFVQMAVSTLMLLLPFTGALGGIGGDEHSTPFERVLGILRAVLGCGSKVAKLTTFTCPRCLEGPGAGAGSGSACSSSSSWQSARSCPCCLSLAHWVA